MLKLSLKKIALLLAFAVIIGDIGCMPTIALYDQYAYIQAISVKVDALNLIDLATEDYQSHQKEITALNTEIQKVYEYDIRRSKDSLTVKQWDILKNPSGHLLGSFFSHWKNSGKLSSTYIDDKKTIICAAFDQIIKLEVHKNKAK